MPSQTVVKESSSATIGFKALDSSFDILLEECDMVLRWYLLES